MIWLSHASCHRRCFDDVLCMRVDENVAWPQVLVPVLDVNVSFFGVGVLGSIITAALSPFLREESTNSKQAT